MELTREQKEELIKPLGIVVAEKIAEIPDSVLDAAIAAIQNKEAADALPTLCPLGTVHTDKDGVTARVTGYNLESLNAIFTLDEPGTYEINIQQLRSLNLLKE